MAIQWQHVSRPGDALLQSEYLSRARRPKGSSGYVRNSSGYLQAPSENMVGYGLRRNSSGYLSKTGAGFSPASEGTGRHFITKGGESGRSHRSLEREYEGKKIARLQEARSKLEARWAREAAQELEQQKLQNERDEQLAKERMKIMEFGTPEDLKKFDESAKAKQSEAAANRRMRDAYQNQLGLTPQILAQLQNFRAGGVAPNEGQVGPPMPLAPQWQGYPQPAAPPQQEAQPQESKIIKKVLKGSNTPVEVRARTKDGKLVVQNLLTLEQMIVSPEELGQFKSWTSSWSAPSGI